MAEGAELIRCALDADVPVESVYVSPDGADDRGVQEVCRRAEAGGVRVFPLAAGVLERVADTVTPQPVLAVLPMLEEPAAGTEPWSAHDGALVVVLVDVRDPGNAGTVLRAADASGSALVVYAGDSVDPYNPKTVRSSAGSLFHVPLAVRARSRVPWPPSCRAPGSARWPPSCGTARTTPGSTGRPHGRLSGQRVVRARSRAGRRALRRVGHPDGRAGRIAQRRRGLRRGLLRGLSPTTGRRCRAT